MVSERSVGEWEKLASVSGRPRQALNKKTEMGGGRTLLSVDAGRGDDEGEDAEDCRATTNGEYQ